MTIHHIHYEKPAAHVRVTHAHYMTEFIRRVNPITATTLAH